jgi:glycosyltransferase involved in cell wall biosynthesis
MTRDEEFIQIIIPCFNGQDYLEETLVSIQNQTHNNFDCLMVDDGSSDDSSSIFNRFTNEDPRFRLLRNEMNRGESYSVNRGWEIKKGELICVLSFDDPQPLDWLEKMLDFRKENPGFIVYYPNRLVIDDSSKTLRREVLFDWSESLLREDLLCIVSVGAIIDSRLVPKDFEPRIQEVVFPSDLVQYLKLSNFGGGIRHPSYFSNWREHGKGKSADSKRDLAKEFTTGMSIYLSSLTKDDRRIRETAVFVHIVRILHGQFSLVESITGGLRIFHTEFEFRTLSFVELLKILMRFCRRKALR